MRGGADGRCRGHEHAFPPPSLHVSALLEILDNARDRVRVDAEEAGQLPNAGQGLVARDAASLDGVLELLRQLPAARDRAVAAYLEVDRARHNRISTIVP